MAQASRPHHRHTYAEYLAYERDSGMKHEFFDGDIFAMAGGGALSLSDRRLRLGAPAPRKAPAAAQAAE